MYYKLNIKNTFIPKDFFFFYWRPFYSCVIIGSPDPILKGRIQLGILSFHADELPPGIPGPNDRWQEVTQFFLLPDFVSWSRGVWARCCSQKLQNLPTLSCSIRCRGPNPTSSYRKGNLMNLCHLRSERLTSHVHKVPSLLSRFSQVAGKSSVPTWERPRLTSWDVCYCRYKSLQVDEFSGSALTPGTVTFVWRSFLFRPWPNRLTSADSPPHFLLAKMKLATLFIFPLPPTSSPAPPHTNVVPFTGISCCNY